MPSAALSTATATRSLAVSKIPANVWSTIFALVVDDWSSAHCDGILVYPSDDDWQTLRKALATLCVVCKAWRHAALLTGNLWTNVNNASRSLLDEDEWWYYGIATSIGRSQGSRITLWFEDHSDYSYAIKYLPGVLRLYHIRRMVLYQFRALDWRRISMSSNTATVDWSALGLTEIHLLFNRVDETQSFLDFLESFTSLSKLVIHDMYLGHPWFSRSISFPNLKTLYLSDASLSFIEIILEMFSTPCLEECFFYFTEIDPEYPDYPPPDGDGTGDDIDNANSDDSDYESLMQKWNTGDDKPYISMPEYFATVRLFTFGMETVDIESIRNILESIPNVETLEFRSKTYISVNRVLPVLHLVHRSIVRRHSSTLACKLRIVRLDTVKVSCAAIVNLLENRKEAGCPIQQIGLTKNYADKFSEQDRGDMGTKTEVVEWEPRYGLPDD